ncbi:MAG: hypothetical protein IT463_10080, partial [Planctomycetes bacterium]|nr:hypothetical protein [Planctomycetota bacterium]
MGANDRLDELFFSRALERGLLRPAQVTGLRGELNLRRADDPDLCAHELAVERGYLTVEAALALLDASAGDTIEDLRARLEEPSLGTEPAFSEENLVPEALDSEPAQSGYPYTQGRDTERLARVPAAQAFADHSDELGADEIGSLDDESSFGEVPRLVEPVAPSYAVPDSA